MKKSVSTLGYLSRKQALESIMQEECHAYAHGTLRASDLKEVTKFANLYKEGSLLRVALRKKSFTGTLLGFKRHKRRGWMMGILSCNDGSVRDITIDPIGYESSNLIETLYDPERKNISLVTPYYSILQISLHII